MFPALARRSQLRHSSLMAKPAIDVTTLTAEEKLELIDELWQSLGSDDLTLSAELRAELDRRVERIDREGPTGVPWDHVKIEMTAKRS